MPAPMPPVRIQSGLHVGSVVAQRLNEGPRRYAIVGAPAHVASRLAALAAPGDVVLSSGMPAARGAVRPHGRLRPGGPRARRPRRSRRFASPGRPAWRRGWRPRSDSGLTPYVGRAVGARAARELRRPRASRRRSGDRGRRRSGRREEPAAARAARAGRRAGWADVLQGRCRAFGDVAPYCPFIEIVRGALQLEPGGAADSGGVVASVRAIDASLEPFLPLYLHLLSVPSESHPLPRHLQGEHLQAALLDALARSSRSCRARPRSSCCSRTGIGRTAPRAPCSPG